MNSPLPGPAEGAQDSPAKPTFYVTPGGAKRRHQPNDPTFLYWLISKSEEIIYIGVAFDLEVRFATHATYGWWHLVERFEARRYETRREALAAETEEIKRHRPPQNVAGNRGGFAPLPYPRQFLTAIPAPRKAPPALEGTFGAPLTERQRRDPTRDSRIPDLVSVAQAAKILGVPKTQIMRYVDEGLLPGALVDRTWVFRRDAVLHRMPSSKK